MFEYHHTRVEAVQNSELPYPAQEVQNSLNEFGRDGWELVAIVPDWEWDYDTVRQDHSFGDADFEGGYSVDAPYSEPRYISGWYCTFKRSV